MIKLKRQMVVEESVKSADMLYYSQASINSNGCLTIRNYNDDKNQDEIIILSNKETEAIIKLFDKLKQKDLLPF